MSYGDCNVCDDTLPNGTGACSACVQSMRVATTMGAREAERERIVAWLRKESDEAGHVMRQHGLKLAADEIERGEHWRADSPSTEGPSK
jgi:hypothetical protein